MEPSYSVLADALSKFHMSTPWIQALWLASVSATLVGTAWCFARAAERIVTALLHRREIRRGHPVTYALSQAPDGGWLLYAQGGVYRLTAEDIRRHHLPRELREGLTVVKSERA